ncbi:MAG: ArsC/Spx/MgsR family protein [Egibacteraceae bacterium]
MEVLLLGHPKSQATRKASRWFAERRIDVHERDLRKRPASPKELRRWADRLGAEALVDETSKPYEDGGLAYLVLDDDGWLERLASDPRLLRLPLVRCGNVLAVGEDPEAWQAVAEACRAGT